MVQFHLGKVLKVIKPGKDVLAIDSSVHAIVEMWDNNQLMITVEHAIAAEIKESDVVVVDYNPIEGLSSPVPKQVIVKILRGKLGKECWNLFRKHYSEKTKKMQGESEGESPAGISYSR